MEGLGCKSLGFGVTPDSWISTRTSWLVLVPFGFPNIRTFAIGTPSKGPILERSSYILGLQCSNIYSAPETGK